MTADVRFAGLVRSAAAVHCERAAVHFPRAEGRRWHARGTVHSPIELGAQQLTRGFDGELGIDDFATASPRHSCVTEPVAKAATCGGQGSASPWISSAHMYLPHVEAASDTCCAISRTQASTRHPRPCHTCRGNSQVWGRDGRCVSREGVSLLRPPARRMRYTIDPDSQPTVPVPRSLYMQAPVSMLRSSIQPITRTHGQEQAEYVGMTTRRHVLHARYHEVHGCLTM